MKLPDKRVIALSLALAAGSVVVGASACGGNAPVVGQAGISSSAPPESALSIANRVESAVSTAVPGGTWLRDPDIQTPPAGYSPTAHSAWRSDIYTVNNVMTVSLYFFATPEQAARAVTELTGYQDNAVVVTAWDPSTKPIVDTHH